MVSWNILKIQVPIKSTLLSTNSSSMLFMFLKLPRHKKGSVGIAKEMAQHSYYSSLMITLAWKLQQQLETDLADSVFVKSV